MSRALSAVLLVVLLACVPAAAVAVPPAAAAETAGALGHWRTVVVAVDHQPVVRVHGATRAARLRAVTTALRATARTSQGPLLKRLRGWRARGWVRSVTPTWISNTITVTARPRVIRRLRSRSDVLSVRPDRIRLVPAFAPGAPNQVAIRAPAVWDQGHTGQGVVVASLDSGVDATHPDLSARWRGGSNSWFDPYGEHPTTPTDLTGHGTGVTGVMLAGDASGATLGTAPGASWIAARVFDDSSASSVTRIHEAFQWLLDPDADPTTADAPQVVNASWSIGAGPGCDLTFQPDVQALRAAGILSVFPAGNFGPTASTSVSPANYPESISVGAVSDTGLISSSSSRGPSTCAGRSRQFPDLVAPGVDIYTTDRYGLYQYTSGTSVAAPHVAGVLALLVGARPGLTADAQQELLTTTATDLGVAGPDETYGHGQVDAASAFAALPPPPGEFDLAVTPSSIVVEAGGTASFEVQISAVNGFSDDVELAIEGVPTDIASAFSPPTVAGGSGTSTLTLTTSAQTVPGRFALKVSAIGGAVTRQADVSLTVAAPPPTDALVLSTTGNVNPPGVSGVADDADLYAWSGSAYTRDFDATLAGLPVGANIDGLDRVDPSHFYLSFATNTLVPGLGRVQDEDVVYYNAGAWSVFFDGTSHGLTADGEDLDAISVRGSTLYFSTFGNVNPPGVPGMADDADLFSWNGTSYARAWNATRSGLPRSTNVDGVVWVDATNLFLSFSSSTTRVPTLGSVQDEDVVQDISGTWSVYFEGTSHGLGTSAALDVDAFDLP